MTVSRSIHVAAKSSILFFLRLSIIPLCVCICLYVCVCVCVCVYTPHLPYPSICLWAFRLLPCPGCLKAVAVNTVVHVSFQIMVSSEWDFWVILQFYFQFFKNPPFVHHSGCTFPARVSFLHLCPCLLCHRLGDHWCISLSLDFLSCPFGLYLFFFTTVQHYFDDCSFVVQSEDRESDSSSCVLLSQDCFGYSGAFVFPYKL